MHLFDHLMCGLLLYPRLHILNSTPDLTMDHCDTKKWQFTTNDPNFTIQPDGTIVTVIITMVPANGRQFSVLFQDPSGQKGVMKVYLGQKSGKVLKDGPLKRFKRRWSPLPFNIIENDDPPFPKNVELVRSDSSAIRPVYYTISGPGVTEGLFSVDKDTGMLLVNRAVDREKTPEFVFQFRVFDIETNQETDEPLPFTVNVIDVNDNAPTFTGPLRFTVLEQSKAGTVVGIVKATDLDQSGTDHSKIRYSLLSWNDLFFIDPETGVIATNTDHLDREAKDTYLVTVQIQDMNGAGNGLSNTATATVVLGDINDNPPTFTKSTYSVTIKENQEGGLILRIPVEDKDMVNTPNWNSEFVITKGNENGNVRIECDPKTNDGLIYQTKAVDYEKTKNLKLEVMARNQAELNGTLSRWESVPVDVSVEDVDEGPEFTAPTMFLSVKENTPNDTLIGTYIAVDPETKSSAGISYYKVSDPASWISVDKSTGQLKIANTVDRESRFVTNGMYNVPVKAVDSSLKTGTGTVIILVEDVNDHVPDVPSKLLLMCEEHGGVMGSVLVLAEDKDQSPYSAPFSFSLGKEHDGKWALNPLNDTAVILKQAQELRTGLYPVSLIIKDLQGFGKTQTVTVRICHCRNGACLPQWSSTSLGARAILAMMLALALLLLFCITFFCVTKNEKMEVEAIGGMLLESNIEAPGNDNLNRIYVPSSGLHQSVKGSVAGGRLEGVKKVTIGGALGSQQNLLQQSGGVLQNGLSGRYVLTRGGQYVGRQCGSGILDDHVFLKLNSSPAWSTWLTTGNFLQEKLAYLGTVEERQYSEDIIHQYGYEGVGSPAGSVGCCSDQGNQEDLDFLNTLGPKFKTLAEVCKQ
ncbi:desmocollin-2-like isoform X2 [Esox lucius]|uniref:desmocollin-2-like isoform X2 n=1 Tax=Esox lucius TaxID=8010 RepID=UPI001476C637|nr:desmocollin-2-like isoform X2 [Esox lucius]